MLIPIKFVVFYVIGVILAELTYENEYYDYFKDCKCLKPSYIFFSWLFVIWLFYIIIKKRNN